MPTSSWLAGSIEDIATQNITVDANGAGASATTVTFANDGAYITHTNAALSMIARLAASLVAAGVTNADVTLTQSGYVRIVADVSFVIVWTDTVLRDALGFTGTVTDTSAPFDQTAPNRSPLLWVPRRNESPSRAPLGIVGDSRYAARTVVSSDGTQVTRVFGDPVRTNEFTWIYIDKDQYWSSEAAGELFDWLVQVGIPGVRFLFYRQVEADYSSASEMTTHAGAIGPYKLTNGLRSLRLMRSAEFQHTECKYDWTAEVLNVSEYPVS